MVSRGHDGRAGLLATLVYLPWLVRAWWYYGTPVPHTVTAKGLSSAKTTLGTLLEGLGSFPWRMWSDQSILAGTFMPAYSYNTGWPRLASEISAGVALGSMLLWLVPKLRWEARVAPFGALAGQFYLHTLIGFPVPWYLPAVMFLSPIALGLALAQVMVPGSAAGWRRCAGAATALMLGGRSVLLAGAAAWQLRQQQRSVEDGHRRVIGEWLKAQAASPRARCFSNRWVTSGFFRTEDARLPGVEFARGGGGTGPGGVAGLSLQLVGDYHGFAAGLACAAAL